MKKQVNQEMLNKFLNFLNEIRASEGKKISLTALCKKHHITNHASTTGLRLGLISFSVAGKTRFYKAAFDHYEPIHAKQLYEACKKYAGDLVKKGREKRKLAQHSAPIPSQSQYLPKANKIPLNGHSKNGHSSQPLRKISILWGLYSQTY